MTYFFPSFKDKYGAKDIIRFRSAIDICERITSVYILMLDFYGLRLLNMQNGKIGRSKNYEERYLETLLNTTF